jgi:hypothetical protein
MAIVNMLKFNKHSGAMLSDEEFIDVRWRRCFYLDSIHSLLSGESSDLLKMEAVYGGVGNPSVHDEVINKVQKTIDTIVSGPDGKEKIKTAGDIGNIALSSIHSLTRRKVDDILKLLYGFTTDDFNQGYVEIDGKKIDIKQDAIKDDARKIISFKDKRDYLKPVFENKVCLMAYDREYGLTTYCIKADIGVLSLVSGGFETLGKGVYGSGRAFGNYFKDKYLSQRRDGMDRVEGMCLLIASAIEARDYYLGVGGYFNIIYLDGEKDTHSERYKEIFHHRVKLATEIVTGFLNNELSKDKTYEMLNDLLFEDQPEEAIEDKMWHYAKNHRRLELLLRGYKDVSLEEKVNA